MKKMQSSKLMSNSDSLGNGIDAALVTALFLGIGFLLDQWLGTTPWCMIGLFLLGAIGTFAKFWYQYDARMNEHETQRQAHLDAVRQQQ